MNVCCCSLPYERCCGASRKDMRFYTYQYNSTHSELERKLKEMEDFITKNGYEQKQESSRET